VTHRHVLLMTGILIALAPVPARAQEPAPPAESAAAAQPAPHPAQPPAPTGFTGSATLGLSLESGRTDLNGLQFKFAGSRPYSNHGALTVGSSFMHATARPPGSPDRITVANRLDGSVGIEHNYGERWVLMVRSQALRDPIARIDHRFEQIAGFGVRFGNKHVQARVVPGVALLFHDKNIEAENGYNTNVGIYQDVRIALAPGWMFMESLSASHDVRDDDDYFFAVDAQLTGAITRRIGLQLSFHYNYESLLPPGVEPWYQKTMAGLQFKF
jgi:hypothetical protein